MGRALERRGERQFSGEGDGVPQRHDGARQIQKAVSGVRRAGAAHRLRGERDELLREMPDGGPFAGRPGTLAPAQGGLAEDARSEERRGGKERGGGGGGGRV